MESPSISTTAQAQDVSTPAENGAISEAVPTRRVPEPFVPPSKRQRCKRRMPRTDKKRSISPASYKSQLQDTSDILRKFDLAPPSKRAMFHAKYHNIGKYFANPGRSIPSPTLSQLFYRALALRTEIAQDPVIANGCLPLLDSDLRIVDSRTGGYVQEIPETYTGAQIEKKKAETFDKLGPRMSKTRHNITKRSRRVFSFLRVEEEQQDEVEEVFEPPEAVEDPLEQLTDPEEKLVDPEDPQEKLEDPLSPDPLPDDPDVKPPQELGGAIAESLPWRYPSLPIPHEPIKMDSQQPEYKEAIILKNSPQPVNESPGAEDYHGDVFLKDTLDYMKKSPEPAHDPSGEGYNAQVPQGVLIDIIDHTYQLPNTTEDENETQNQENGYGCFISSDGVFQLVEYAEDIPSEGPSLEYSVPDGEVLEYESVEEDGEGGVIYGEIPEDQIPITTAHDHQFQEGGDEIGESEEWEEEEEELEETYEFGHEIAEFNPMAHGPVSVQLIDFPTNHDQDGQNHPQSSSSYGRVSNAALQFGNHLRLMGEYTMSTPGTEDHPVYILCVDQPAPLINNHS